MKVMLFAMPTIPATIDERRELRPIGRSTERYQRMLEELRTLATMADDLGYTAFATTEHHFHTEGAEANPSPLLLFADLAARTKRLMFIPLSLVLTAADPIRIAEEIALFDQLYPGRVGVGFARGYQKRWLQILAQRANVTSHIDEDSDRRNREIFDEHLEIVRRAWTQDAFDFDGRYYQVPFPYDEGIAGWGAVEWTREHGADGELDEDGVIRKVGVIPRPYQEPHPPIFQPFVASPQTLLDAARTGIVPMLSSIWKPDQFLHWCEVYRDEAAKHGRELALGESISAAKAICIGDSYEAAFDIYAQSGAYEWFHYYGKFGFFEALRTEADDPGRPVTFASSADVAQRLIEAGACLIGSPDDVKQQLEPLLRCYGDGRLEWLVWEFFQQGTLPLDVQRRQLERFTTEVLPAFR
jgi:alkanesulfonate monooxygenase SsuD/methylene tetrahydromethanopterin reductase-like flavin-dependent oxidoreductase (luciferase family)